MSAAAVAGAPPSDATRASPFPGLQPFGTRDAAYFFGREADCEIVADNLLAYRLSLLFGPSGAGKSSLLRAGVLPLIAREEGEDVRMLICSRWGEGTADLRRQLGDAGDDAPLAELLAAAAEPAGRLLLVLDQFEELFAGGEAAIDELGAAIADAGPALHAMIVIRDDALARLERLEGAVSGLFEHLVQLGRLDEQAARKAILRPIEAWNAATGDRVRVAPELVDAVLADLRGDEGSINAPYLQLVMRRLWEAELGSARLLDARALARQGGVERIVATHVDGAMAACSAREQRAAAAMLGALVTPAGAKQPQHVAHLAAWAGVSEADAAALLERLAAGDARLLEPLGDGRYQLAHDALAAPLLAWRERRLRVERRRRERRRLLAIMAFVALLLALVTLVHGLDPLELATVDARFALRGRQPAPRDLLLVAIDDASLAKLGADWPVSRTLDGDAIDWIGSGRPRVIAYDVDFSGRRADDASLAEAIDGADKRVVLAAEATAPGGRVDVLGGNDVLALIGARPGYAGFAPDLGGVIRHPLYAVDGVKSFAVAAAEVATGRTIRSRGVDAAWLDYYGPQGTVRSIPFWEVVRHRVPSRLFRDKVVVVGVTSAAIDRHPVWGLHASEMPGAEIQATAIETLLRGLPLRSPSPVVPVVLVVAFALLPPLVSARRSPLTALLVAAGAGALYLGAAAFAFDRGLVLPVVAPLAALLLATFAVLLLHVVPGRGSGGLE